ncbi:mannosylglycerate synthase domain-containing protein [Micromonospora sp. NPDC000316]|uniref:mannosylglycerate synthase domain-containing protein n=1 Tax=Micromonospora sp. NPDC000316 TaxID=3364216 RepID=UPI0036CF7393
MSLIVFPFKEERADVVVGNIKTAAHHPRTRQILAVAESRGSTYSSVESAIPEIGRISGTDIVLVVQDRIGVQRSGKGDAMNTGLKFLVSKTSLSHIHFYDADITNFSGEWITKAGVVADQGFDVVRHNYPRARCDAMITWMITRVGFALLWPKSSLATINQPLGGEVILTREVAERMLGDARVVERSDWGIDTAYTFASAKLGFSVYEIYVPTGKQHKLYDSLADLRTMLIECFATLQALKGETLEIRGTHYAEEAAVAPRSVTEKIGFDVESTLSLLMANWTPTQVALLQEHFPQIFNQMELNLSRPSFGFMDESVWGDVYASLLASFVRGDADWEELLFKLWSARVLYYTTKVALCGYEYGRRYLERTIDQYRRAGVRTCLRRSVVDGVAG